MESVALILGALLAAACVVFISRPFLREPAAVGADDRLDDLAPAQRQRLLVAEERDRALAGLRELELDHRTGKVSDEDYRELVSDLRQQAAAALRALDQPAREG